MKTKKEVIEEMKALMKQYKALKKEYRNPQAVNVLEQRMIALGWVLDDDKIWENKKKLKSLIIGEKMLELLSCFY